MQPQRTTGLTATFEITRAEPCSRSSPSTPSAASPRSPPSPACSRSGVRPVSSSVRILVARATRIRTKRFASAAGPRQVIERRYGVVSRRGATGDRRRGASLAGLRACETLRTDGHAGPITLIGAEPHLPYDRPPLSKKLLAGEWEPDRIALRPAAAIRPARPRRAPRRPSYRPRHRGRGGELAEATTLPYDGVDHRHRLGDAAAARSGGRARSSTSCARSTTPWRSASGSPTARHVRRHRCRVHRVRGRRHGPGQGLRRDGARRLAGAAGPRPRRGHGPLGHGGARSGRHRHPLRRDSDRGLTADGVALSGGTFVPADVIVVGIGVAPRHGVAGDERARAARRRRLRRDAGDRVPGVYAAGDVRQVAEPLRGGDPRRALDERRRAGRRGRPQPAGEPGERRRARTYAPVPFFWSDQGRHGSSSSGARRPTGGDRGRGRRRRPGTRTASWPCTGGAIGCGARSVSTPRSW